VKQLIILDGVCGGEVGMFGSYDSKIVLCLLCE